MDLPIIILLSICGVLLIAMLIVGLTKKPVNETNKPVIPVAKEEPEKEAVNEPVSEEPKKEVKEESKKEVKEEVVATEEAEAEEELPVGELSAAEKIARVTIPFAQKILESTEDNQTFYNALRNKFKSYRHVNARVSKRCDTISFSREPIAKIIMRGKTLKLHLALDVNDYDANKYHQKFAGDKKAYELVPFVVKVKSGRALNNAFVLIEEMMQKKGIVEKTRYEEKNYLEELKEKLAK